MKTSITISCILALVIFIGAGIIKPKPLKLEIPKGWPKPPTDIFKKNPLTEEGFELGKKLFYDGNLSLDGNVSCGSCHQQFAAFATYDHDLSHGVNNTFSTRNAPTIFNLAWMKDYHWDGGINHIEVQPLHPFTAANEMGENIENILRKIKEDPGYPPMFRNAFGDDKVTSERVLKSLAQFTGSIVSNNSKYDKVMRGETSFNNIEQKGYVLFKANCETCHKEPLFTDNSFRNNGAKLNRFKDVGRMMITGKREDSLKFKVPSLRNIQVSFPYMHDGSIFSVPQVIDHYTSLPINEDPSLDPVLKNKISFTPREKNELIYFLYSLTDSTLITNERYAPSK